MRVVRTFFVAAFLLLPQVHAADSAMEAFEARLAALENQVQSQREQLEAQAAELKRLRAAVGAPSPAAEARPMVTSLRPQQPAAPAPERPRDLGGFRFSGDFRYRFDLASRAGNEFAAPLQNIRGRYRVRVNIDKSYNAKLGFHLQLASGQLSTPTTNDQDMSAFIVKGLFSVAEAWMDYRPHPNVTLRGGRVEDVFADQMRLLWDTDTRFNGFQQMVTIPVRGPAGLNRIEFRAGEYMLSTPNLAVIPAGSPLANAGYRVGSHARTANLFHPGIIAAGERGDWSYRTSADFQFYRNPHHIQLASTTAGAAALLSPPIGVDIAAPLAGAGNAVRPGGFRYAANHYQIGRLVMRMDRARAFGRAPFGVDAQLLRNFGAGSLRDAIMLSANVGEVRNTGDMRFLYQFTIKDANSLISQFTDSDLGTQSGVNLAVHGLRWELGFARNIVWQNVLYLQNQRRGSNPAAGYIVPLPRGAHQTRRFQSELIIGF